jgi:type VI secretion system protein ImpI
VRVTDPLANRTFDRVFPRLPVRIGRNVLNDLQLDHNFVSQFHAVLELQNNRLMLRDLGSTNGTVLADSMRVPPNQLVDLSAHGFGFSILALTFQTYTADTAVSAPESRRRPMGVTSMLKAPPAELLAALAPGRAGPELGPHQTLYANYRMAWTALIKSLSQAAAGLDPETRRAFLQRASAEFPGMAGEPDFQHLAAQLGVAGIAPPASAGASLEAVALQGLKEISAECMPDRPPPESPESIVQFLGNLQETLEVFFKCFIPLRDGHKQFEADLAVGRGGRITSSGNDPQQAVQTAKSVEQLAKALLDYRSSTTEAARSVESTFADVMIHQVAMLNGVMRGVKSLLSELSPESIERAAEDPRNRSGLGIGPYRFKSLWGLYQKRYQDLADEDKQVFSLLFGSEFALAYGQFRNDGAQGSPSGPPAGAPFAPPVGGYSPAPSAPSAPNAPGSWPAPGQRKS